MGLTNDELAHRYRAGEPLDQLAADADMTVNGVQARLRRIGVPPRRQPSKASRLTKDTIAAALDQHGSINAAAKAPRHHPRRPHGRSPTPRATPYPRPTPDLLDRYNAGATQTDLAAHYGVATSTVGIWLQTHGITRRRGRRPFDG